MRTFFALLLAAALSSFGTAPVLAAGAAPAGLVALGEASSTSVPLTDDAHHLALAQRFVTDLIHGDVDRAVLAGEFEKSFTSQAAQSEAQQLRRFGTLQWIGYTYSEPQGSFTAYYYNVAFDRGLLTLCVQVDASGKIVGFTLA